MSLSSYVKYLNNDSRKCILDTIYLKNNITNLGTFDKLYELREKLIKKTFTNPKKRLESESLKRQHVRRGK